MSVGLCLFCGHNGLNRGKPRRPYPLDRCRDGDCSSSAAAAMEMVGREKFWSELADALDCWLANWA